VSGVSGVSGVVRGRLRGAADAPVAGERSTQIAQVGNVAIEQILSGTLAAPVDFDQPHDEWVVVLAGAAALEVGGERVELVSGDWLLLPANVPHRLLETQAGTSWLALHASGFEVSGE
jgi:cupin 2 domain-containing protein